MGRRRKKYKKIPKKIRKIPKIFQCPNCGARTLTVRFEKLDIPGYKKAIITCGTCGLYAEMQVPELYEPLDVYAKFIDAFEEGSIQVEFRKKEKAVEETGGVVGEGT
jgi:transcription elongation factor Elf1